MFGKETAKVVKLRNLKATSRDDANAPSELTLHEVVEDDTGS